MSSRNLKNHTPDFERKAKKTPDRNTSRLHEPTLSSNSKGVNLNLSNISKNKETHRSLSSTNRVMTNNDHSSSKSNMKTCGRKIKFGVEM